MSAPTQPVEGSQTRQLRESPAGQREHRYGLLHQMVRIRRFEERCVELYSAEQIRGSCTSISVRRPSPPG
jgi:TPP-dependent pyruvate/acetoin dehydrogenase alpha subunit